MPSSALANERNGLIDGWRGLSVFAVVIAHFATYRYPLYFDTTPIHTLVQDRASILTFANNIIFRLTSPAGDVGVSFFFVISGYLITRLLLIEESKRGQISIAAFYVRRVFRIMPAFYLYMLVVLILRSNALVSVDHEAFIRSGLYVCNFSEFKCSWWLAHTWSLSAEEQFYLIWPLIFSLFGKHRTMIISVIFLGFITASYFYPLGSFAYIAIGALVASSEQTHSAILKLSTPIVILGAGLIVFLHPLVETMSLLSTTIKIFEPLLIALIFFGTVNGKGPFVWLVSIRTVQKLGVVSYSVYLWQQVATAPDYWGGIPTGALSFYRFFGIFPTAFIILAIASYILVERPMIAIGRELSSRIMSRRSLQMSSVCTRGS